MSTTESGVPVTETTHDLPTDLSAAVQNPATGRRVLHMIGNAHIDPVWLWQWPEGYQEVRATFRSALDRLNEYPEFIFTCDSVLYLAWVEENDPDMFEEIRHRVNEGRFVIVGGWWVEPDCNIPAGESFVRQGLHGQRWLAEKLDVTATVGCNVDPFGHNAMLPQILRGLGMDSYLFLRPGPHERTLPGPAFWWQSPDGSRVVGYRIPNEYCSPGADLGHHVDKCLAQLPHDADELMVLYGVGNHGGGPTRRNLDSIRRLHATDGMPDVQCSSPRHYLDRLHEGEAELDVHDGELQKHAAGCYSAHSGVKRWNRRAENLLLAAEKWATIAALTSDVEYPKIELIRAWRQVLFNQFHDILAGTSIEPAYQDARDQYGEACSIATRAANRGMQAVSRRINIPFDPDTIPLVVFNPHPWGVHADVELEFGGFDAEADLDDDTGSPVPVQRTRSHVTASNRRRRLVFPAELPPLGYRTYRLRQRAHTEGSHPVPPSRPGETVLENDHLRAIFDEETGWLAGLVDRSSGAQLVPDCPGPHAVVVADSSDTWGHRVASYQDVTGIFRPTSMRVVESGPVRSVLRIESAYGDSTLVEEVLLGRDRQYLEVRATLDWREQLRMLKLRFPSALPTAEATYEIPYGHLRRTADGGEESQQRWVDVAGDTPSGQRGGWALVNDGKHGADVSGSEIGLTIARSPVYAWHEPRELDPSESYSYLDQGIQRFAYLLVPHQGDWRDADVVRLAAQHNQAPFPLLESAHEGPFPERQSFADVTEGSAEVTVVKLAEASDEDVIVRVHESHGRDERAVIELPVLSRRIETSLRPSEIKTFRIPRDPARSITETDLREWEWGPAAMPARGPSVNALSDTEA